VIQSYDYGIIAFYFLFILIVGVVFRRLSRNTSDYFRCGGAMPWWITGTSAWIASFSAWTFVGAAAKVYETGTLVLWSYYPTVLALIVVWAYTCVRFRRMRVVTWMEGVAARYGVATEQFYTFIKVPLALLLAGVSLNAIGVFMSTVFGMTMLHVLIALGLVVTIVALVGGSWAVLASDFVQMFLVVTICIVTAALTLAHDKIGGINGLLRQVPRAHFHWTELSRPGVIWLWAATQVWFKFSDCTNMENSTMYLMAKSDRDARRMVLIPIVGSLLGPLIWFIPSMAATILHPNLAAEFPAMKQPHEAAFVAVARDVMPVGLMGLLLCAMLGATITSMDAGLNKGVGVFVRSFYRPLIDPKASEKRLLVIGKICTGCFGAIVIGVALIVDHVRTLNLFDLSNMLAGTLLMPLALPLVYGMFVKRTPAWAAWSTALVGFAAAYLLKYQLKPDTVRRLLGWPTPLRSNEIGDFTLGVTTLGTVAIGSVWYFAVSILVGRGNDAAYIARNEQFFKNLATPIDIRAEGIENRDEVLYRLMGQLCMAFGGFILLLMLIPNPLAGRLCFLLCGGTLGGVGAILYTVSRRKTRVTTRDEKPATAVLSVVGATR
jgi:Na+/proline symporter